MDIRQYERASIYRTFLKVGIRVGIPMLLTELAGVRVCTVYSYRDAWHLYYARVFFFES